MDNPQNITLRQPGFTDATVEIQPAESVAAINEPLPMSGVAAVADGSAPAFRANTEMDECDVICPHCGEAYQAEGEDFSENEREETCECCGGRYVLYDEFTVTHHTRALPNARDVPTSGTNGESL